jgi:predicted HAD superfamily phosphohydrolase YqeG
MWGMYMRRLRVVPIASVGDAVAWVAGEGSIRRFIVDLDNTLVPYHAPDEPTVAALQALEEQLRADAPHVTEVVVLSNGRRRIGSLGEGWAVTYRRRARKPFTRGLEPVRPSVVCGDQFLTDGLLAWRLDAPFLHLALATSGEPAWPRVMRVAGTAAARWLSTRGHPTETRTRRTSSG